MKFLKLGLILFFFSLGLSDTCAQPLKQKVVRVAVITDAEEITLIVRSAYRILTLNTNEQLSEGRRLWRAKVLPTACGIKIDDLELKVYGVRIQPQQSPAIYLNGRKFRGAVDIIRQSDKKLLAINHLDVEEYVAGVLYHEVAPWWPLEALKAQAIACRTFALYQSKVNAHKDYDLVSTVYSQVYGGSTSERGRTSRAVKLTKEQVLTYKDKIFPAFFHATCAGHTEDASRLWKIDLPPLRGRQCQFCQRSPHFQWKQKIPLQTIEQALKKADFKVGPINSIEVIDRDVSGRITELEIVSSSGKIEISGNRFRLALGPNIIRSTNFDLEIKSVLEPLRPAMTVYVYFQGYGWGHGVGMCQWGAFFMSRQHFNAEQILGYYYPQSKIKKIKEIVDAHGNFTTF